MPRLFGAYLNSSDARPGILVNSAIPIGARRHAAAHELGHHRLHHSATIEDGGCLQVDPIESAAGTPSRSRSRWTDQERTAEAFAAWFLMPRRAVTAAMRALGVAQIDTATQAYQLSLILGTSYRSTVRHLPNLRLASLDRVRAWAGETPSRIKARLDPAGTTPDRGNSDVWVIDHNFDGMRITLQPGDRLAARTVEGVQLTVSGMPCLEEIPVINDPMAATCKAWAAAGDQGQHVGIATLVAEPRSDQAVGTVNSRWTLTVSVGAQPAGLDEHWLNRMASS